MGCLFSKGNGKGPKSTELTSRKSSAPPPDPYSSPEIRLSPVDVTSNLTIRYTPERRNALIPTPGGAGSGFGCVVPVALDQDTSYWEVQVLGKEGTKAGEDGNPTSLTVGVCKKISLGNLTDVNAQIVKGGSDDR